ncbi:MAG: hypothetical protein ACRDC6_24510 [Shewanella sp.]
MGSPSLVGAAVAAPENPNQRSARARFWHCGDPMATLMVRLAGFTSDRCT